MKKSTLFGAVLSAFLLFGCSSGTTVETKKNGFEVSELGGQGYFVEVVPSDAKYNSLLLENSGDKPTLYSFFTSRCPECVKKFPHLIDMQNRYQDKINLIGVFVEDKNEEAISEFVSFHNLNYPIAYGRGSYKLADAVGGVRMVPAMHLYDRKGNYVAHFIGPVPQEMIEKEIEKLLK